MLFASPPPFKTVGCGAFGQVFRCYAAPPSAVGDETKYVAVKVLSKFTDTKEEQTSASKEVLMELDHLCALKGKDGIAQLLSFTETTFDMQFVFPLYHEDLHDALTRGLFRKKTEPSRPLTPCVHTDSGRPLPHAQFANYPSRHKAEKHVGGRWRRRVL